VDEDDDLDAAFVCTVIATITLLNLYAELSELSECCRKRNRRLWVNLFQAYYYHIALHCNKTGYSHSVSMVKIW